METLQTINRRRSIRSYTGALSEEALQTILKAGQEAAVGRAMYETMHMTVIRNRELLGEIDKNGAEFFGDPSMHPLYGAPCLILISTIVPPAPQGNVPYSNAAFVADNMILAATDIGIGNCAIWGAIAALNTKPELVAKLNLPEGHTACCAVAVGETEEKFADREIPLNRIAVSYID